MLTNEQKRAAAEYGNEQLLKLITGFLQGYPDLEKRMGRKLDSDMKSSYLTSDFRSLLQQINKRDTTILTDPKTRAILLDTSKVPKNALPTWNGALKEAEA